MSAVKTAIPVRPSRIGDNPSPAKGTAGAAIAIGGAAGTGGGPSTNGSKHPFAGTWFGAEGTLGVAVEICAPHNAVIDACDPKMLSATIGLIERTGGAPAELNAGAATSERDAPIMIAILPTLRIMLVSRSTLNANLSGATC